MENIDADGCDYRSLNSNPFKEKLLMMLIDIDGF
jgi:hypothetical protein